MESSESAVPALVTFRGGFVADWTVVVRLLHIEARGARFELVDGGRFRVVPKELLTPDDVEFFKLHRDEARRVLEYEADDAHRGRPAGFDAAVATRGPGAWRARRVG